MLYSKSNRLHVSAGRGHHQVFVVRHTQKYYKQLCVGLFDAEISTSGSFFGGGGGFVMSILGVWVSPSVNLKVQFYNIKKLRNSKNQKLRKQSEN
jgi:hypothetical protein